MLVGVISLKEYSPIVWVTVVLLKLGDGHAVSHGITPPFG